MSDAATPVSYYDTGSQRSALQEGAAAPLYLLGDHLGSTAVSVNSSGAELAELRYKPWGEPRYEGGSTPTRRRFTGQTLDFETGLYYYGARYYDPALGRFYQPDSIVPEPGDPQSLNRFAYAFNNPLRYTDPTGHCPALPQGYGAGICFALFIEPESVRAGPFNVHGDNRKFGYGSDQDASRAYVWLSVADPAQQASQVNPSGYFLPVDFDGGGDGITWFEAS
ncbi:MAG: RHS repeat-associated core domain-containing protein, partial [Ardenticatenaceae bacterium]